ncbi:TatD family hydrolase [Patescibacteria group bacterium]|nr:TatD family hydrolase [Patescibacteria group bacterium]
MLIDTHAHLDFKEYDKDRAEVIQRAFDNGVEKIITIGCSLERSQAAVDLAQKYDNVYASIGIHPDDIKELGDSSALEKLYALGKQEKVVAVGEIGLEYYQVEDEKVKKAQVNGFREQLNLAKELELPVILHCRDAYEEMIEILKSDGAVKGKARGVVHCFLGNKEIARQLVDLGYYLSFTGIITFKNATDTLPIVAETPLERIMVETDCPYLAPEPNRGKRNEPAYVRQVAEQVASTKEVGMDKIEEATTNNAINLFNL